MRVLLHTDSHILLFRDTDPGLPGSSWWNTPGGGIEPNEAEVTAAVRELAEETGLAVQPDEVQGPLARRVVHHGYSDQITIQDEAFYSVAVSAPFDISTEGHTDGEKLTLIGYRWWPIDGLSSDTEAIWPTNLTYLLSLTDAAPASPVELPDTEESSVPLAAGHPSDRI